MSKHNVATVIISLIIGIVGTLIVLQATTSCFATWGKSLTGYVVNADGQTTCDREFSSCTNSCSEWLNTCNIKCDSGSIIEECYSYCSKQEPNCSQKCTVVYDTCFKTERQKRTPLAEITKICTEQKNTCEQECNPKLNECRESCKQKTDAVSCKEKCAAKKQETCDKNCNTRLEQCNLVPSSSQTSEQPASTLQRRQPKQQEVVQAQQQRIITRDQNASSLRVEQKIPPEPIQTSPELTTPEIRTENKPAENTPSAQQEAGQPQKQVNVDDYKKRIDALLEASKQGKVTDENFIKNMERLKKTFPLLDATQVTSFLKEVKTGVKTYDDLKQLLYQTIQPAEPPSLAQQSPTTDPIQEPEQKKENNQPLKPLNEVVDTLKEGLSAHQEDLETGLDNQEENLNAEESDLTSEEEDLEQWLDEDFTDDTEDADTIAGSEEDDFGADENLDQEYEDYSSDDSGLFDEFGDAFGTEEEFDIDTFEEEFNTDDYGFDEFGENELGADELDNQIPDEFSDLGTSDQIDALAMESGDILPLDEGEQLSEDDLLLGETIDEEFNEEETSPEEIPVDKQEENKKDTEQIDSNDEITIKRIDGADVKIVDGTIREAKAGATLREKTKIVTGQGSKTNLNYKKNMQARIDQKTEVLIKKLERKNFVESIRLKQETGTSTYKITKIPEIKPDIETPNAIVRIDGVVEVKYDKDSQTTTVRVFEGKAYVTSLVKKNAASEPLTEKQQTTIKGKANLFMRIANALR